MRNFTIVFGIALAGIAFSFGMSVITAVKQGHEQKEASKISIPLPAGR